MLEGLKFQPAWQDCIQTELRCLWNLTYLLTAKWQVVLKVLGKSCLFYAIFCQLLFEQFVLCGNCALGETHPPPSKCNEKRNWFVQQIKFELSKDNMISHIFVPQIKNSTLVCQGSIGRASLQPVKAVLTISPQWRVPSSPKCLLVGSGMCVGESFSLSVAVALNTLQLCKATSRNVLGKAIYLFWRKDRNVIFIN